jgi:simple sugar transport system ATP-binding protein
MSVLRLEGISKHFGAIHALSDVSMELEPGEVVGLMGDNGAGKSTLVKIIAGNFPPTHGRIHIKGRETHFHGPLDARRSGIEIVYQDLALCDNLTAAVNVFLGREMTRRIGPLRVLDYAAMNARAAALFKELRSETRPRDKVKSMSGGQRQAVAIARAVYWNARLVIMDEPTAALGVPEQRKVHELVRTLKQQNVPVIIISHNMQDIFASADRIIVMRRGHKVGDVKATDIDGDGLVGLMVGAGEA